MISRYFISLNLAAFLTFGLFLAMQYLIMGDSYPRIEEKVYTKFNFGEVRPVEEKMPEFEKPELDPIEKPPEKPILPLDSKGKNNIIIENKFEPVIPTTLTKGTGLYVQDADYIPIVKVAPQYPQRAMEQGLEGYVRVQFTIMKSGETANVTAIEASHKIFERNAVKAVEKFKFKPKIVDGEAIPVTGVTNIIEFKME